MKKKRTPYYSGFTLIEMLIVLLIISVLAVSYTHLTLPTIYSV